MAKVESLELKVYRQFRKLIVLPRQSSNILHTYYSKLANCL